MEWCVENKQRRKNLGGDTIFLPTSVDPMMRKFPMLKMTFFFQKTSVGMLSMSIMPKKTHGHDAEAANAAHSPAFEASISRQAYPFLIGRMQEGHPKDH